MAQAICHLAPTSAIIFSVQIAASLLQKQKGHQNNHMLSFLIHSQVIEEGKKTQRLLEVYTHEDQDKLFMAAQEIWESQIYI